MTCIEWETRWSSFIDAIPAGQPRPRVCFRGGRAWAYNKSGPWMDFKKRILKRLRETRPVIWHNLVGPVKIQATFVMPRPKRSKFVHWPLGKPDIDNMMKVVMDALQDRVTPCIQNDSQVVEIQARKLYAGIENGPPGASIIVSEEVVCEPIK